MADNPTALREELDASREEIRSLTDLEILDEDQETRLSELLAAYPDLEQRTTSAETRAARIQEIRGRVTNREPGHDAPSQINRRDPFATDLRNSSRAELRDAAMRITEERGKHLATRQQTHLEGLLSRSGGDVDGSWIAERMLLTENDDYRSAFMKGVVNQQPAFTAEESDAVNRFRNWASIKDRWESRANEGTPSAGGYGIPVLIDPTIILSSGAAAAPILDVSRIVTITTNQWKGVSSAGFNWAYQAEAAAVADNSPTLAQPTIPVYGARGFIPYTLELEQDYPGFQAEMSHLLDQGYVNLLAIKTMVGSGSGEPTGIFTGMAATTTNPAHITVTTLGTLGAVDIRKAWGALPERFRQQPSTRWVMNVTVENLIRAFGNNLALSDYTVNLAADGTSVLTGRPVILTDYAPSFTGTTGTFSYCVVGDFQHFVIVQRAGMTVELVPHLFDVSTGRPIGERGWFAFARNGFDASSYNAFRLVSNT